MASTYSPNLSLELIGTGDQAGTWGNTTNTNLGTLIEQAISGYVTQAVSTGTDTTITIPNGATGVARNMYIELTGTGGASTNLIVPANKKLYFIFNNTSSGQVTVKVSGQTGVSVPNKAKMILVSNGTDIVDATNYIGSAVIGNLTATSGTITTLASTSAAITTLSSGSATLTNLTSTSGTISTLASTSAAITTVSGTTLTYSSGTITNLASTSLTLSNNPTLSGGTANGVLYLNGSKVATSGSALTFDGTDLTATGTSTFGSSTEKVIINRLSDFTAYGLITFNGAFGSATGAGIYGRGSGGDSGSLYYNVPTGAAQRFQVNGDTKLTLDTSGNLGIGTSSPSAKLHVAGTVIIDNSDATNELTFSGTQFTNVLSGSSSGFQLGTTAAGYLAFLTNNTERMRLDTSGNLGLGVTPSAWSTGKAAEIGGVGSSVWGLSSGTTYFTAGYYFNTADKFAITGNYALFSQLVPADGSFRWVSSTATGTAGNNATMTERLRLDSSGNLGLGVTPSAWSAGKGLEVGFLGHGVWGASSTQTHLTNNVYYDGGFKFGGTGYANVIEMNDGAYYFYSSNASGSAGGAVTWTNTNSAAMTLDASGNLGVGNTSPQAKLHVGDSTEAPGFGTASKMIYVNGTTQPEFLARETGSDVVVSMYASTTVGTVRTATNHPLTFLTDNTERGRFTAGGDLLVGKTGSNPTVVGCEIRPTGVGTFTADGDQPLIVDRLTNDGTLVLFRQANTDEGSISVSGNTVSYNPFMGSHYTEIVGEMPTLKGTVLESVDDLVTGKYSNQDRLPKAKISDAVGSKAVYGVYFAPDSDPDTDNGILAAALGASWVRVNGSVAVQKGDLLESNGDGTARVQADDIIRSSTIGKVTSTVKTHEYDDGSYCVPTVLYCG